MSGLTTFTYAAGVDLRTATDVGGETIVCLADLAQGLGIKNVAQLRGRLSDGVCRTYPIVDRLGRTQQATFVTEAGMNMVIWRSDKPEAIAYAQWCAERIAELRRHGLTATPAMAEAILSDPDVMIRVLTELKAERQARAEAEAQAAAQVIELEAVRPKAQAFDRWLGSSTTYGVGDVAKALSNAGIETGRNRLFRWLLEHGWLYRDQRGNLRPYQDRVDAKHLTVKLGEQLNTRTGETFDTVTIRVLPKGAALLATRLGADPEVVAADLNREEVAA